MAYRTSQLEAKKLTASADEDEYEAFRGCLRVLGDRWSLLIVRELMLRGPQRYTDLQRGVLGIASNLLASRLVRLESAGIIERFSAPPPVATSLFRLTKRGRELKSVIGAISRWITTSGR